MTITIGRNEYTVSRDGQAYLLTGVRGACYRTFRHVNRPEFMFLVSRTGQVDPLGAVVLTDANGTLERANEVRA